MKNKLINVRVLTLDEDEPNQHVLQLWIGANDKGLYLGSEDAPIDIDHHYMRISGYGVHVEHEGKAMQYLDSENATKAHLVECESFEFAIPDLEKARITRLLGFKFYI